MRMAVVLLSISCILSTAQEDFDFFYFVQQWPGAYCDTTVGCCYPETGKPYADFGIHGLWPNYDDGGYPSNCDNGSPFLPSEISDLRDEMEKEWPSFSCPSSDGVKFWSHEWTKHGTCSESVLDQHDYFEAALRLKAQVNLFDILSRAGIHPDGGFYTMESIRNTIQKATGLNPGIECNTDGNRQSQLFQVFLCVDTTATNFIDCPVLPRGRECGWEVVFPVF
ncbi:unnamed protein product [Victoria cruziana]